MLQPGTTLGPYEVTAKLGAGGMGEVYHARDTKLDRDVALKVLPEAFTSDPDRLARFEREARVLASLNHPNIGHIYGLEEADGTKALVLELVAGPTLAERIAEGPMAIDDALSIARQIIEALAAAHDQGVMHRDLKPANVKVRSDGTVKVLDFGLAKALQPQAASASADPSNSPTLTARATELGVVLGTAAYMAPEQARGQAVDQRVDIWSFGCVLYEMLTGKRPFAGADVPETLASVLRAEPDWEALPARTPHPIRTLLRRTLVKAPDKRLHHIADARFELEEALESGEVQPRLTQIASPAAARARRGLLLAVVSALVLAMVGGAIWRWPTAPSRPASAVLRFPIGVPAGFEIALDEPGGSHLAVAPDGSRVAFVAVAEGERHLFVRAMEGLDARRLPGTEGAEQPFFSPGGEWIGFFADNHLMKVAVAGGSPVPIAEAAAVVGASWGSDDQIVLGQYEGGLRRVSVSDGQSTIVTTVDTERGDRWHVFPQILRGGDRVLYTVRGERDRVEIAPLTGGEPRVVLSGSRAATVVANGYLVYPEAGGLMAAAFDLSTGEVNGAASLVVEDVYTKSTTGVNNAAFSVSNSGALAYQPGVLRHRLAWLDGDGSVEVRSDARWGYWYTDVSPVDGLVATTIAVEAAVMDIWVLGDGLPKRVTTDQNSLGPRWTRDGERVAFTKATGGSNLHWQRLGSQEPPELLVDRPGMQWPGSFSPDNARLAFHERTTETGQDIREMILESRQVRDLVVTPFNEARPDYSPDGRWLVFSSDQTGQREIWVMRLADGALRQITEGGGSAARWSPDGSSLVYSDGVRLWRLEVSADGVPDPATVRALPEGRYLLGAGDMGSPQFAVAPDGRVVVSIIDELERQPIVVWNWLDELERQMASK